MASPTVGRTESSNNSTQTSGFQSLYSFEGSFVISKARAIYDFAENLLGWERLPSDAVSLEEGVPLSAASVADAGPIEVASVPRMDLNVRSGEVRALLQKFAEYYHTSVEELSDPALIAKNQKPRIELRRVVNEGGREVANIALCFANGTDRDTALAEFKDRCKDFSIVSAGSTTLEIGNFGVDKGTVLDYLARSPLKEILPNYQAGPMIDAEKHHSILAMDADGTLWGKPQVGQDPTANNLANSPACKAVLSYLRAGGVIAVISGNDPQRTIDRFKAVIPKGEEHLLSRVILSGAGGHTLMVADAKGEFHELEGYRELALGLQSQPNSHLETADIVYLGDDHKTQGNDFAGFKKVTMDHAVCVTEENDPTKRSSEVPTHVVVEGGPHAVGRFIQRAIEKRKLTGPTVPLFVSYPRELRSSTRSTPDAHRTQAETLRALGDLDSVRDIVHRCDNANGAVTYSRDRIDLLLGNSKMLDLNKTPLNYEGIQARSEVIGRRLRDQGENLEEYFLANNINAETFEAQMNETLDSMKLHEGSVIRILEPGNNDQLNPMHVARMIKHIKDYEKSHGISVTVQVIIMGQGGHATTGLWHQFAEISEGTFTGTTEADSLSGTLQQSLERMHIAYEYDVDKFTSHPGQVQIKFERESRHTGQNMQKAKAAHEEAEGETPEHILVAAALPGSLRQTLTAAAQYSEDNSDPMAKKLYASITGIPYQRSRAALMTFDEQQIITEMYASLAERARFFIYGYRSSGRFIPAGPLSPSEMKDLEHLYQVYGRLNGLSLDAAKQIPIDQIGAYFYEQYTKMEVAIPWVKETGAQFSATQASVRHAMAQKMQRFALD